jgi:hypothetical protein
MCTVEANARSAIPRFAAISSALERLRKGIRPSISRMRRPASSIARTEASRFSASDIGDQVLSRA